MGFARVQDVTGIIPAMGILERIFFSITLGVIFCFYHHSEIIWGRQVKAPKYSHHRRVTAVFPAAVCRVLAPNSGVTIIFAETLP